MKSLVSTQLIGEDRFRAIDKIKTIGSTYMAAVGLIPEFRIASEKDDGGISAVTYLAQVLHKFNVLRSRKICIQYIFSLYSPYPIWLTFFCFFNNINNIFYNPLLTILYFLFNRPEILGLIRGLIWR